MKSFKQHIHEEQNEKKDLFHSFFVSKSGKIIEPTSTPLSGGRADIDHIYIPLHQPHDFDMSDKQMDHVLDLSDLEKLQIYKTGMGPIDSSVDRRLSSRGFIKGTNGGWLNGSRRKITLTATTSSILDRHHLDDLTPAIKSIRERLTDHPDWQIEIHGLKFHEPHELESMRHRLSPFHIQQLTDTSRIHLINTQEIDRFITGRGSLSRDPGSGVHSVPSPEEQRRKAGRTDEPESIQRGRFFTGDSYIPTFINYLKEFTDHEDYEGNTLFAVSPDGKLLQKHFASDQIAEHADTFPHLNFGRPTTWEETIGMGDKHKDRPEPITHGRIDHKKKMIMLITKYSGSVPYGDSMVLPNKGSRKSRRDVETDAFQRLTSLSHLEPYRQQNYKIYHSYTEAHPISHSFSEHEKYLMSLIDH